MAKYSIEVLTSLSDDEKKEIRFIFAQNCTLTGGYLEHYLIDNEKVNKYLNIFINIFLSILFIAYYINYEFYGYILISSEIITKKDKEAIYIVKKYFDNFYQNQ